MTAGRQTAAATIHDSCNVSSTLIQYLLVFYWIEKMPSIMKETPTLFVVGAGHLPGTNGVLKLLKEKGYTVEPMK